MRNLIQIFFMVYLGSLLAGCATPNEPIAHETGQRIKRIAVVSVTARVFTRQYTGVTMFGNEKEEKDISIWKVDEKYEEQIATEIERIRGISPIKASYQVTDFLPVNKMPAIYITSMYTGANWDAIESATKAYCANHALDAILLVAQTSVPDFFTESNQFLGGAGFYVRGHISRISVMHLMSKLALLDCITGKPLAVRTLSRNQHPGYRNVMLSTPYMEVPDKISRMPISAWTPELQEKIRADLILLPAQSWGETIQSIFGSTK